MHHYNFREENVELIFEFFKRFAWLEYALKRAGFLENYQDRVKAAWARSPCLSRNRR